MKHDAQKVIQSDLPNSKTLAALRVDSICAGYPDRPVLHDVSLNINKHDRLLLIGPNGCGKTTLLKVIAGILKPKSGKVFLQKHDITHQPVSKRITHKMGYLMQTRNVFTSMTVEENLHLGFWHGDGGFLERRDWILQVFPMLKDRLDSRVGLLSGGERQALAIGMVLMRPVNLLLLDEPTAGLSPKASEAILKALHEAQEKLEFTSILVEHNLRNVRSWVTQVTAMNQGRIVADREAPEILMDKDKLHKFYF